MRAAGSVDRIARLFRKRSGRRWRQLRVRQLQQRRKPPTHDGKTELADPSSSGSLTNLAALELERVYFAYPVRAGELPHPAIETLTLRLGLGLTAVVGPSGCGKSTLLQLLLTWYEPQLGYVRLRLPADTASGHTRVLEGASLRAVTSVVFQDTPLLQASVHANIALGAEPPPSRSQVNGRRPRPAATSSSSSCPMDTTRA